MNFQIFEGNEFGANQSLLTMKRRRSLNPLMVGAGIGAMFGVIAASAWWLLQSHINAGAAPVRTEVVATAVPVPQAPALNSDEVAARVTEMQIAPQVTEPVTSMTAQPTTATANIDSDALARTLVASSQPSSTPAVGSVAIPPSQPVVRVIAAPSAPSAPATQIAPLPPVQTLVPAQPAKKVVAAVDPKVERKAVPAPVAKPAPVAPKDIEHKPVVTDAPKAAVSLTTKPVAIAAPSADACAGLNLDQARGPTPISKSRLRQIANGVATFHGGCRLTAGSKIGSRIITEIDASTLTIKTTGGPINFFDDGA